MDFSDLRPDQGPRQWSERPDGVLLEGAVGNRAYGLPGTEPAEVRLGVFLAPSDEFFGLDDVAETVKNPWSDEVLHELGRFCRLALKTNPVATELLWLDSYLVQSQLGIELVELRHHFLSAAYCRNAYLDYAGTQFFRLKDRGSDAFSVELRDRTSEHARGLARLLVSGYGLWSTGRLQVCREDSQQLVDFGEQVANGDLRAAEELLAKYTTMFETTSTALPAEPDRETIDRWLRGARQRSLLQRRPPDGNFVKAD